VTGGRRAAGRWCVLAAIPALVVAGGCLRPAWPRGTWTKPGVEREQRQRDEYECERQAVTARGAESPERLYERCMEARGYRRQR
jgi:hypothetical protein